MFYLSNVEITGFWGKYSVSTEFYKDVNIIIGKNGTGKTTFMNLLQGVLTVDLRLLAVNEFDKIILRLRSSSTTKTISVEKRNSEKSPYAIATFKVGHKSFEVPLIPREIETLRAPHRSSRIAEVYQELKILIDEFINIASLSVHRASFDYLYEDDYIVHRVVRRETVLSPIDQRLKELVTALTQYQLSLAEKANDISAKFQKDVLTSILYDEKFDRFDMNEAMQVKSSQQVKELEKAYNELGVLDDNVRGKITNHIDAVHRSLTKFRSIAETKQFDLNDILPLPLLRRTQYIINLSLEADKQKQLVSEPIRQFIQLLTEFMRDKEISVNSSTGELVISRDSKSLTIFELSSGEKQLLILLIETILQRREFFIFFADEPELSLHIEWQAKIISSIKQLNSSSQIIVATHSPEIAGSSRNRLIDMEDIVHG